MAKTITLSDEEIDTLYKVSTYLTPNEIKMFFPKLLDIIGKTQEIVNEEHTQR